YVATVAALALAALAGPASAQQLIDAGGDTGGGGLAFVAMVVMVFAIATALFFMDRIRRRRTGS
ncbi:MAG: hypothetical protein JOZ99_06400, partial [Actinobacteria bacterium]|nr:hypothetical protein [Actinomycetota bacterium]